MGRKGRVSGALREWTFQIFRKIKIGKKKLDELYKNLELHCAVIGAEGGPWEWTVNTSRFLRRALVIIGIDSREGLCICATIHVLFCYIMGLVKRYVGFRALLLKFMDMETKNLADGHIDNLTLTFNPSCYLSCLL